MRTCNGSVGEGHLSMPPSPSLPGIAPRRPRRLQLIRPRNAEQSSACLLTSAPARAASEWHHVQLAALNEKQASRVDGHTRLRGRLGVKEAKLPLKDVLESGG